MTSEFSDGMRYEREQLIELLNRMRKTGAQGNLHEVITFVLDHIENSVTGRGEIDDEYFRTVVKFHKKP